MRKKKIHIILLACVILLLEGCGREDLQISASKGQTENNEEGIEMITTSYTYQTQEINSKVTKTDDKK